MRLPRSASPGFSKYRTEWRRAKGSAAWSHKRLAMRTECNSGRIADSDPEPCFRPESGGVTVGTKLGTEEFRAEMRVGRGAGKQAKERQGSRAGQRKVNPFCSSAGSPAHGRWAPKSVCDDLLNI